MAASLAGEVACLASLPAAIVGLIRDHQGPLDLQVVVRRLGQLVGHQHAEDGQEDENLASAISVSGAIRLLEQQRVQWPAWLPVC